MVPKQTLFFLFAQRTRFRITENQSKIATTTRTRPSGIGDQASGIGDQEMVFQVNHEPSGVGDQVPRTRFRVTENLESFFKDNRKPSGIGDQVLV